MEKPFDVRKPALEFRPAAPALPRRGAPPPGPWGSADVSRYGLCTKPIGFITYVGASWLTRCLPGGTRLTFRGAAQDRRRHAAPRPDRRRRLRGERRPTFRDANGLWENHPVEKVATPGGFQEDPRLVWRFYSERRRKARDVRPNPGHAALAVPRRRWATASSS